jgi:hypothetical protein
LLRAHLSVVFVLFSCASLPLSAQSGSSSTPKSPAKKAVSKPAAKGAAGKTALPSPAPAREPPPRVPPDLQLVSTHTSGDTRTTSTVQLKGARARIAVGDTLASIQQCDANRTVQLNTQTKTALEVPFAGGPDEDATSALQSRKRGGEVIYSTAVTDTGETQTMFGLTARHLRIAVTKDFTTNACDRKPQRVETDGWYVDLPSTVSCATVPQKSAVQVQIDPQHSDCVDEVKYEQAQAAIGYPLKYTVVSTTDTGSPVTTMMEVTQLERVDLPAEAFEVPADYVTVHSVSQLTADHRPGEPGVKKPGTLRVGLMPVANRSASSIEVDALDEALLESFSQTDLDIVRLRGSSPAEIEADAKAKQVDLVLTNTVAEVKTPRGGLVGRISGSSGEAFQARVDYALAPPGQSKPAHSGSERSGGSSLATAVALARKVAQFAPPLMMARYGYLNAYGSMLAQGGTPMGGMQQTPDPVMNMAFSLLDRATAPKPSEQFATEESAVASALEKVIKSVVADVAKLSAPGAKRGQ